MKKSLGAIKRSGRLKRIRIEMSENKLKLKRETEKGGGEREEEKEEVCSKFANRFLAAQLSTLLVRLHTYPRHQEETLVRDPICLFPN